jgi:hypothetical protein
VTAFNIKTEIDRLQKLRVSQLQEEFALVTGEIARSNNRAFLVKRIAWRKQAIAQGGLSERAIQKAATLAREQDLRVRPRPEVHAAFAESDSSLTAPPTSASVSGELPAPGAWLTKVYKGRRLEVKVLERGFEFEGQRYGSLSAIAKAVTGCEWNGKLFFGLKNRGEKS